MRLLCSKKAGREGGECLAVSVEIAPGGPVVEVQETSMAEGWTGCRFSPSALWLALKVAQRGTGIAERAEAAREKLRAIEFGCGLGLAGLAARAAGYHTTLTDCLPGHLKNLTAHAAKLMAKAPDQASSPDLHVRFLDWISDVGTNPAAWSIDSGSPENVAASSDWERLDELQLNSFDLALASDVVYEEHHAMLLPRVMQRWLKPGGFWAVSLAIRDADMSHLAKFYMCILRNSQQQEFGSQQRRLSLSGAARHAWADSPG
ncbi:unnamed protein product [Symbiodinium pilosum]|uniref:Uncharacterized protein n=1 Tax=Symbiodinium pilosum TaxID=2952 RepID=A0A812XIF8_SYMPI|nr:unnamed protein product [Symbiodinium pilosum]